MKKICKEIITGNINKESRVIKKQRGWIFGCFNDKKSIFYTKDFEIKWAKHKKGEFKKITAQNNKASTFGILIYGKMLIKFPLNNKEVLLEKEGDFIFYEPKIFHTWIAKKNSFILIIRWPSILNDQMKN